MAPSARRRSRKSKRAMPDRIGLIAGNRQFPLHVARAAKSLGVEVVAIGIREETSQELEPLVARMHWIHLGQAGRLIQLLRQEQVNQVLLAGQVHPSRLTRQLAHLDGEGMKLLARAATLQGRDLLTLLIQFLQEQGFQPVDSSTFLKAWIPEPGVLTSRGPTPAEQTAIAYGQTKAQALAAAGIGQTLVVKERAVVALEAIEGTDATIRRAGELAGPGTVVVKLPEPRHDLRVDIPVVGMSTLEAMGEAGATALAVAAGKTLLLERPALIERANQQRLALVAVEA